MANRPAATGDNTKRNPDEDGKQQRKSSQLEMAYCPARQFARKRIIQRVEACAPFKIQICGSCIISCPLSFRIQTNHSRLIQRAFQAPQCCDCVRAHGRSEQEDCLVFRKKMKVVLENDQIILLYFCICRVGVLYSNRPIRKGAVTKRVIDANDILLRQSVARAQWPPAIIPLKKLMREPDLELRIFSQVADCADAKRQRFVASHDQRVCIVETQRSCYAHAKFFERISNLIERHAPIAL